MRARVYVDGFNLCRGALRERPSKWLNPVLVTEVVRVYRLFRDRNKAMTGTTTLNWFDLLYGRQVLAMCVIRSTAAANLGRS